MATATAPKKDAPTRGQNSADREQALHELADDFGDGVGNAEELINANSARRTADLATIQALPIIQDATNDLDLDKLEGPDGEYVVDAVIRGSGRTRGTIVVYEDETNRTHKYLAESNLGDAPAPLSGPRRSSQAKEPEEDAKPDAQASKE